MTQINSLLGSYGKQLKDYPTLPTPSSIPSHNYTNSLIQQELSYDKSSLQREAAEMFICLNDAQKMIYEAVMLAVTNPTNDCFYFVHGYGGTGKTYLWNALAAAIRSQGEIVLVVASSGISATLLPAGRTAHSRFAIPIHIHEHSMCSVKHRTELAELLQCTKLIIWDEAPMVRRHCIEAFDRTMRDIMHCEDVFGGKCVLMGGDFRQILPVLPKASRPTIVDACISSSKLWRCCKIFQLTQNMRLECGGSENELQELREFNQ